jgi:hypothetical protein
VTQVIRVLPLWYDATPLPRRKQPHHGFSDIRKGHGGRPRLTDDEVRAMRLAGDWHWPAVLVGRLFAISSGYAEMVMRGDTHAHVR